MVNQGGSYGPFYSDSTNFCAVSFPCDPPAVTTGWCGVLVKQDRRQGPFSYMTDVVDATGFAIGTGTGQVRAGETFGTGTLLATSLDISGSDDPDAPVSFSYNGVSWDCSSSACSVGAYSEVEIREMDCGFSC